jgi:hypothetical protein
MSRFNLLVTGFVGTVLLAGCIITPTTTSNNATVTQTYWLDYALTQCNTAPWGKTTEPDIVSTYYASTLTVFAVEVTPPTAGMYFCSACGCPTGTVISIQTDTAGQAILLEQGFTDAAATEEALGNSLLAPDMNATATTTTVTPAIVASDSNTSADIAVTVTPVITEVNDTVTEESMPTNLTGSDIGLYDRADQVETALADYYTVHGSYPEDIATLGLVTDLTGITYTPIGALPASYYDLAVVYTVGAEILNP